MQSLLSHACTHFFCNKHFSMAASSGPLISVVVSRPPAPTDKAGSPNRLLRCDDCELYVRKSSTAECIGDGVIPTCSNRCCEDCMYFCTHCEKPLCRRHHKSCYFCRKPVCTFCRHTVLDAVGIRIACPNCPVDNVTLPRASPALSLCDDAIAAIYGSCYPNMQFDREAGFITLEHNLFLDLKADTGMCAAYRLEHGSKHYIPIELSRAQVEHVMSTHCYDCRSCDLTAAPRYK